MSDGSEPIRLTTADLGAAGVGDDPRGRGGLTMECCGKVRATRFCPDCGKKLGDGPIDDLIVHLRTTWKKFDTEARGAEWRAGHEIQPEQAAGIRADAERARRKADRYQSWIDALLALASAREGSP